MLMGRALSKLMNSVRCEREEHTNLIELRETDRQRERERESSRCFESD